MTHRLEQTLATVWESSLLPHVAAAAYDVRFGDLRIRRDTERKFSSASMIKTPLLALLLDEVTHGKLEWTSQVEVGERHVAASDGVLRHVPLPARFRLCDIATFMISVSDNTAANVVIDLLGGPDAINSRLETLVGVPLLRRWFSGRGEPAGNADLIAADPSLPSQAGVAVMSVADYDAVVDAISASVIARDNYPLFLQVLSAQLDRRSLARYLREDVPFAHKTGLVDGVRHDAGFLTLRDKTLRVTVFTDSQGQEEEIDDPVCRAMGVAFARTLRLLGGSELLTSSALMD